MAGTVYVYFCYQLLKGPFFVVVVYLKYQYIGWQIWKESCCLKLLDNSRFVTIYLPLHCLQFEGAVKEQLPKSVGKEIHVHLYRIAYFFTGKTYNSF